MPDLKKDFQWVAYKDANNFQVFKTSPKQREPISI